MQVSRIQNLTILILSKNTLVHVTSGMLCNIQDIFSYQLMSDLCSSPLPLFTLPHSQLSKHNIQEALFNNVDALHKNYQDLPSSNEQLQALVDRLESKIAWKTRAAEII